MKKLTSRRQTTSTASARGPDTNKYAEMALAQRAFEARLVPTSQVVTAEWVRLKCQYGCAGYGKRLCCPPNTPTPEAFGKVLGEYQEALIYAYQGGDRAKRRRMQRGLAELERTPFLDGWYKAFALGAGPCRLCKECDTNRRCRHPYEARPSMESCGIDVYATCRNAGITLDVVTCPEDTPKYIHLLLID
jgi:predicted metal-binding protein